MTHDPKRVGNHTKAGKYLESPKGRSAPETIVGKHC